MVEKIKNESVHFKRTTGPIRLSVDDLIEYLSNTQTFETTKFEATCGDYRFKSLEDMKANRELLSGRPKIFGFFEKSTYHDFTIEFDEGAKINAFSVSKEQHIAILNKASTNIISYRGALWILQYFPPFIVWGAILGIGSIFLSVLAEAKQEGIANEVLTSNFPKIVGLLIIFAIFREFISRRNPVFFGKKSNLWEKVKENALSHIIVFSIGICLTWLVTKFGIPS